MGDIVKGPRPPGGDGCSAERVVRSTCPFCGVGCQVDLHVRDGLDPTRDGAPSTPRPTTACCASRAASARTYTTHPGRLTRPLLRSTRRRAALSAAVWRQATWDEALDLVADRLAGIVARVTAADSIAAFACAKATNEDNYLLQKLFRAVLGTNNVDHCSRLVPCRQRRRAAAGHRLERHEQLHRRDGAPRHLHRHRVEHDRDPSGHHQLPQARRPPERRPADRHRPAPDRDDRLRHAVAAPAPGDGRGRLAGDGPCRRQGEAVQPSASSRSGRRASPTTSNRWSRSPRSGPKAVSGVPAEDIRQAARLYATATAASVYWGMGISQSTHGTDNTLAITNLALMCGQLGRDGTGLNPLRGQNNVQGCSDSGGLPVLSTPPTSASTIAEVREPLRHGMEPARPQPVARVDDHRAGRRRRSRRGAGACSSWARTR